MLYYSVRQHLCFAYAATREKIGDPSPAVGPQSPHCVVPFAGDVLSFAEMESLERNEVWAAASENKWFLILEVRIPLKYNTWYDFKASSALFQ
jgi:hypothetical protein